MGFVPNGRLPLNPYGIEKPIVAFCYFRGTTSYFGSICLEKYAQDSCGKTGWQDPTVRGKRKEGSAPRAEATPS